MPLRARVSMHERFSSMYQLLVEVYRVFVLGAMKPSASAVRFFSSVPSRKEIVTWQMVSPYTG